MTSSRRSSSEVRTLILKASEEVFARKGYASTTTKDLANEAGVAESMLYRHFPSKAALFRTSVLEPMVNMLRLASEATQRYSEYPLDARSLARLTLSELYDQLYQHRAALRSFTVAEDDLSPEDRTELYDALSEVVGQILAMSRAQGESRGYLGGPLGFEVTSRLVIGMFISIVVHDAWLLPGGTDRPTRAQIVDHVADVFLHGLQASLGSEEGQVP